MNYTENVFCAEYFTEDKYISNHMEDSKICYILSHLISGFGEALGIN